MIKMNAAVNKILPKILFMYALILFAACSTTHPPQLKTFSIPPDTILIANQAAPNFIHHNKI